MYFIKKTTWKNNIMRKQKNYFMIKIFIIN